MNSIAEPPPAPAVEPPFNQEALDEALANAALEGLHPAPQDLKGLKEIVSGNLTVTEFIAQAKQRYGSRI